MKIVLCYLPVLHEGYYRFFQNHKDAGELCILGKTFFEDKPLSKDIRALDPALAKKALESWAIFPAVRIVEKADVLNLDKEGAVIVMPNDELSRDITASFSKAQLSFDSIFLRWDKHRAMEMKPVEVDQTLSAEDFHREILSSLKTEAEEKSSDIWRRIGAAIVKDGEIVFATYNKHVPSEHAHLASGDPRNNFSKGVCVELSTVLHAESALVARAAKSGVSLEGADMYVTVFPCPPCAKTVAYSGVKRLFYSGGYGVLDGADILKAQGVEIIYVELDS